MVRLPLGTYSTFLRSFSTFSIITSKIKSKSENRTEKMPFRTALSYTGLLKAENLISTVVKIKVKGSHAPSQN